MPTRSSPPADLYIDVTTSLCWEGAPVGITRVEREIASRAPAMAQRPVRYCFFHATTRSYHELDSTLATLVLEEGWWMARDDLRAARFEQNAVSNADLLTVAEQLETAGASAARVLATARRRLDGLTLSEVLALRENASLIRLNKDGESRVIPVTTVSAGEIALDDHVWIVNGGLDWEHKDLRDIRLLKSETGFHYVTILYDLIPLLFPQFVIPEYVERLQHYFGELFWTADCALCISETTKRDAVRYLSDFRMPSIPMRTWPLGSDVPTDSSLPAENAARLPAGSYLLYVSTIEPRKNHRTLIEAFERGILSGQVADDRHCVFVGREGWNTDNLLQEVRTNPVLKHRILILSGLSDSELVKLYHDARFVVFPSRYEGYGLSLVEAMALGKACISSDTGSLREVGGEAPLYIPPHDVDEWAQAIARFLQDDAVVADYERRAHSGHQPVTWDASARQFYDIVEDFMAART